MKKLMIAAAIAATVGGAFATEDNANAGQSLIYNFSASLRTTRGVPGASIVRARTVEIGHDGVENYWYTDTTGVIAGNDLVLDNVDTNGDGNPDYPSVTVPNAVTAMTATGRHLVLGAFALAYVTGTGVGDNNPLVRVNDANAVKIAFEAKMLPKYRFPNNAGVYCVVYTVTETDPANCYRVAGATTLNGLLISQNCCGVGFHEYDTTFGSFAAVAIDPTAGLNYYFGSQAYNLANQVEVYASINFFGFQGWLAGQGTLIAVDRNDGVNTVKKRINTLSGNIVGTLPPSQCVYFCCVPDTIARVFACDNDAPKTNEDLAGMRTAAFGTFVIRYNPAITAQYNAAGSTMPR